MRFLFYDLNMFGKANEEFKFEWRIENFSFLVHENRKSIRSSAFITDTVWRNSWYLSLFSHHLAEGYISCHARLLDDNDNHNYNNIDIGVEIVDEHNAVICSIPYKHVKFSQGRDEGVDKIMSVSDWKEKYNNESDTLRINFYFRKATYERDGFLECRVRHIVCGSNFAIELSEPRPVNWELRREVVFGDEHEFDVVLSLDGQDIMVTITRTTYCTKAFTLICKISLLDNYCTKMHWVEYDLEFEPWGDVSVILNPSALTNDQIKYWKASLKNHGPFIALFQFVIPDSNFVKETIDYSACRIFKTSFVTRIDTPPKEFQQDVGRMIPYRKKVDTKLVVERTPNESFKKGAPIIFIRHCQSGRTHYSVTVDKCDENNFSVMACHHFCPQILAGSLSFLTYRNTADDKFVADCAECFFTRRHMEATHENYDTKKNPPKNYKMVGILDVDDSKCLETQTSVLKSHAPVDTDIKFSDFKLRAGDVIFQAHKLVLSARSPVFSAMFSHDMLEKNTGIADIADIDASIVEQFLGFLYTGIVDIENLDNAIKLALAAEKYQVPSLKQKCSLFLLGVLSQENMYDIFLLAYLIGNKGLQSVAERCIRSNRGELPDLNYISQLTSQLISKERDSTLKKIFKFIRPLTLILKSYEKVPSL